MTHITRTIEKTIVEIEKDGIVTQETVIGDITAKKARKMFGKDVTVLGLTPTATKYSMPIEDFMDNATTDTTKVTE